MNLLEPWHIILILIIAVLVFGPKKLPEIGKAVGSAVTEFKKGMSGATEKPAAPPTVVIQQVAQPEPTKQVAETAQAVPVEAKPQEPAG
jgi:sec-independent protein translocase protein TatA